LSKFRRQGLPSHSLYQWFESYSLRDCLDIDSVCRWTERNHLGSLGTLLRTTKRRPQKPIQNPWKRQKYPRLKDKDFLTEAGTLGLSVIRFSALDVNAKFLQVVAGAWLAVFVSFGTLNAFGGTPLINFICSPCQLIFDSCTRLELSVRFYSSQTPSIQPLTYFSGSKHTISLISWPTNRKARLHGLGHFKHSGNSWIILEPSVALQKLFLVCYLWVPSSGVYSIGSELGCVLLSPLNHRSHCPELRRH